MRDRSTASPTRRAPACSGALLVGGCVARSLAFAWGIPAIGVHHMEAHLLAPMLEPDPPGLSLRRAAGFGRAHPAGAGRGHRAAIASSGESLDDAAGEAFDKVAKMLGLGYPGGPQLAALAADGVPGRFDFPRPMTDRPGLDFSFSGLKTLPPMRSVGCSGMRVAVITPQSRADIACGVPGGRGRYPRDQVPARAGADRPDALGAGRRRQRQP